MNIKKILKTLKILLHLFFIILLTALVPITIAGSIIYNLLMHLYKSLFDIKDDIIEFLLLIIKEWKEWINIYYKSKGSQ